MRKYARVIFCALVLFVILAFDGNTLNVKATTQLGRPKNVKAYNPRLNMLYVRWSKVTGADGYYLYYSTRKDTGYKVINVHNTTGVMIMGLNDRQKYYFKVKAYTSIGVVSEDSKRVTGKNKVVGIDVSRHNGTIDWDTVKSNVDFAILRVGYGDNYESQDDVQWVRNANECTRLGIPFGVYIYSYATSTAQASSEAYHVLRLIKNYKLTYPVYYDLEDGSTTGTVPASVKGDMAQTFCDIVKGSGYDVGIYANTYWFTSILTDPRFSAWEKWVAQYSNYCTYSGKYRMWQYSSSERIPGIDTAVDVNYRYTGTSMNINNKPSVDISQGVYLPAPKNVKKEVKSATSAVITWNGVAGSTRYIVYRKKSGDKKFLRVAVTIGTRFEDNNLEPKQKYIYKVCAYTGIAGVEYFGEFSKNVTAKTFISAPNGVSATTVTKSSIKISWNAIKNASVYKIYRRTDNTGKYVKIAAGKGTNYVDTDVKAGVVYEYRVIAAQRTPSGVIYSKASNVIQGISGPGRVKNLSAQSTTTGSVTLTWDRAVGATGYEIYMSTKKSGGFRLIHTITSDTDRYSMGTLNPGKNYYFKIRAIRLSGEVMLKSALTSATGTKIK